MPNPSFKEFVSAKSGDQFIFVKKINLFQDPFKVYQAFRGRGPSVFLESARTSSKMGRFSWIAKDPIYIFRSKDSQTLLISSKTNEHLLEDPFLILKRLLKQYRVTPSKGAPPFLGGAIGYFSYEVKNQLERRLSQKAGDDLNLPDIYFLFFDRGLVLDHLERSATLFLQTRVG